MEFTVQKEMLLKALQIVMGAVERKQTFPILSHILLKAENSRLCLVSTDMEIELRSYVDLSQSVASEEVTIPARKLLDICRVLPEAAAIKMVVDENQIAITSGKSRFHLSTLPAKDFPQLENLPATIEFSIKQEQLRILFEKTHFAMAQQDIRYYLNGTMLIISKGALQATATNGHRLASTSITCEGIQQQTTFREQRFIVPRKAIVELMHLLIEPEEAITFSVCGHHIRIHANDFCFTSKLIDGQFPDFNKVIPPRGDRSFREDKEVLKDVLARTSVLASEKFCGVEWSLAEGITKVSARNAEQELVEEEVGLNYQGEPLQIAFNARYLLDILAVLPEGMVEWTFSDEKKGVIIQSVNDKNGIYVVMPMRV